MAASADPISSPSALVEDSSSTAVVASGADLVERSTTFVICPPIFNADLVECRYRFEDGDGVTQAEFVERVRLPVAPDPGDERHVNAAGLLSVCAGTSYFKVAAPRHVRVDIGRLSTSVIALLGHLYDHGLREFAVENGLPIPLEVEFAVASGADASGVDASSAGAPGADAASVDPPSVERRALVPVGGGKDSALVMSVFRDATPFAIGPPVPSVRVAEASGHELLVATRSIDTSLRTLNSSGALNGHIPVTAITSAVSVLVALVGGFDDVLMGNERSASEPTRWSGEEPVNHQYSKSFAFECAFASAVRDVTAGTVTYFSVLRPFSELAIARGLCTDEAMLAGFLSCNQAFTLWRETEQSRTATWCRDCPKCRFTSLMVAPFLGPERTADIMGGDIFDDPAQIEGFAELWDVLSKPFECVGEMVESAVAMAALAVDPRWGSRSVVKALGDSAMRFALHSAATFESVLVPGEEHRIPEPYLTQITQRLVSNPPDSPAGALS